MTDRDLMMLTNRIAGYFRREPGKVPRCSSYALKNTDAIQFVMEGRFAEDGSTVWRVFGSEEQRTLSTEALFFRGPELLKTAGWLILNRVYTGRKTGVTFQAEAQCEASRNQVRRFVKGVYEFFGSHRESHGQPPFWTGVMVCLHRTGGVMAPHILRADFLAVNTWGEFFFDGLDLTRARSEALACRRIAEHLWVFMKKDPSFGLPFRVVNADGGEAADVRGTVAAYLEAFAGTALYQDASPLPPEESEAEGPDNPLLLDR
jgi:hypothetical protein